MSRSTTPSTAPSEEQPRPWTPHAVQKTAVRWLLEHACAGLFADPGVGKTSVALAAVKILKRKGLFRRGLIVVPQKPLHLVWPDEVWKWLDFHELTLELLHGPKKDDALARPADLYACTPEGLPWLTGGEKSVSELSRRKTVEVDVKAFRRLGFDTLVVDELTRFKSHNSDRSLYLKAVLHTFGRRWGLTGDPAPNGLKDLFGQIYVLDMGQALGKFVTHFRREFLQQDPFSMDWSVREGCDDKIYRRIAPLVMRVDDSHLDIPEEYPVKVKVRLPDEAMTVYKEMEDDLVTQILDEDFVAANAAVATGKCKQIAAGGIYRSWLPGTEREAPGKRRPWMSLHDEKTAALEDLLEELQGKPLLCAYWYNHDLDRIERLARQYGIDGELAVIGDGAPASRLRQLQDRWNTGRVPLLLMQGSTPHGLNLQRAARHVCWYSMPFFNYEYYNQLIRRVRRQGNVAKRVTVYHLIAENTIDEVEFQVLQHKRKGQQALFDALKAMARERRRGHTSPLRDPRPRAKGTVTRPAF